MRPLIVALALTLAAVPAHAAKPPDKGKERKQRTAAVEHLATLPAPAAVSANFKRYRQEDGKRVPVNKRWGLVPSRIDQGGANALRILGHSSEKSNTTSGFRLARPSRSAL